MSIVRDPWERIVSRERDGVYESNYLKANSPDGCLGLWIKHNLLRPRGAEPIGEFWALWFERDRPVVVAKREVPWHSLGLAEHGIGIEAGGISLSTGRACGSIADLGWDLALSGGLAPLLHFPHDWMYTGGFPKKKAVTPAPNLRFDGWFDVGGTRHEIRDWVGLRGHNWGTEHAFSYAYGNCNLWDDGGNRTVDGFSARIRLGPVLSPWLSVVVGRNPDVDGNRLGQWLGGGAVLSDRWTWQKAAARLELRADPRGYAGLRYRHPGGAESYCYNTKFADVSWQAGGTTHTSRCGELEVLFPTPLDGIALHPAQTWLPTHGDYRSP